MDREWSFAGAIETAFLFYMREGHDKAQQQRISTFPMNLLNYDCRSRLSFAHRETALTLTYQAANWQVLLACMHCPTVRMTSELHL